MSFASSRRSVEDYVAWRVERARPAVRRVAAYQPLSGREVLDVGCGYGALSTALSDEGAQVHANAVVLPSVSIGDGAIVGAGSVVVRDVPPGTTVFGNPARTLPLPG